MGRCLVNPKDILFTPDTAGFMAGNYRLEGASSNAIINQGSIAAARENGRGGTIALIAARITDHGRLAAPAG